MLLRSIFGLVIVTTALLTFAGSALAGGWAVATLDALPERGFQADETYRLGYTVRQHGDKPFAGAETEIRIRSASSGDVHAFRGNPEGAVGHYVAEVRFPSAGEWSWEVTQKPFAPQALGTVLVAAPSSGSPASAPAPQGAWALSPTAFGLDSEDLTWLTLAPPLATLLAVALFVQRLSAFARRRRAGSSGLSVPRGLGGSE